MINLTPFWVQGPTWYFEPTLVTHLIINPYQISVVIVIFLVFGNCQRMGRIGWLIVNIKCHVILSKWRTFNWWDVTIQLMKTEPCFNWWKPSIQLKTKYSTDDAKEFNWWDWNNTQLMKLVIHSTDETSATFNWSQERLKVTRTFNWWNKEQLKATRAQVWQITWIENHMDRITLK